MTWTVPGLYRYGTRRYTALNLQMIMVADLRRDACRASKEFPTLEEVMAHHNQSLLCRKPLRT
jgi:hypothetical protein